MVPPDFWDDFWDIVFVDEEEEDEWSGSDSDDFWSGLSTDGGNESEGRSGSDSKGSEDDSSEEEETSTEGEDSSTEGEEDLADREDTNNLLSKDCWITAVVIGTILVMCIINCWGPGYIGLLKEPLDNLPKAINIPT
jgi:hypothetical protein